LLLLVLCAAASFYAALLTFGEDMTATQEPGYFDSSALDVPSWDASEIAETSDLDGSADVAEASEVTSGDAAYPLPESDDKALLALVLDDCGGSLAMARRVVSLDIPFTWAILPKLRYSTETAELLDESGAPFLLHLPMQATVDPDGSGNGGLYYIGVGMDEKEVRDAMTPLLDSLPGAWGVNNHRGSKATADKALMDSVMDVLAERGLFFLDSRTIGKSVAYDAAVQRGLMAAKNNRFLDNESDRAKIAAQMDHAVNTALKNGRCIAICHLRPETVFFLEELSVEEIAEKGVRLVTLPQLMDKGESEDE
jgi:polysaccharide deacetylase 2 family uncharacterized protein YibQ